MLGMARVAPLSGFPEWLPGGRVVEEHVLDVMTSTFQLYGYAGLQTRAVEPVESLLSKGETSKEIYLLRRLQATDDEAGESQLGLHFDLTVPFARYVAENSGKLTFPFKRYQVQQVWRGERPQDGRFREFTQADIDVVAPGELPAHYEVEVPVVMAAAFERLREIGVPPVRISVNNRRVAQGFYEGIGIADVDGTLRVIDKLDKIGPDRVVTALQTEVGATEQQARACLELASITATDASVADQVLALGVRNPLLEQGLHELVALVEGAAAQVPGVVVADLAIARGLDYYTGSVYETTLLGHENLGSICSGGRYDSLVDDGTHTYPGVGMSLGVSRLVSRLLRESIVRPTRAVPTAVLVAVVDEDTRVRSDDVARRLRARGIATEVAPVAAKFGKQIRHADRRDIPFVWFPSTADEPGDGEVKDIRSGEQVAADAGTWTPPEADLRPQVVPGG
ncbi:histidine--tRNA ligase [Pseudactinotalea suaedae]